MYSFWFVVITLLLIHMQKILYRKYIFRGLEVKRSFSDDCLFPGDNSTLEISIVNRKLLPITSGKLNQRFSSGLVFQDQTDVIHLNEQEYSHESYFSIFPYQKIKRRYNITLEKRGHYELISDIKISSTNLFGTENFIEYMSSNASITIYPRLRSVKNYLTAAQTLQGNFFIERWIMEDPMMIKGIRNYRWTDPLKSINWKSTAKHQSLMVNEYDYTAERKVMLIFDIGIPKKQFVSESLPEVEKAIEIAASIATLLVSDGIPVGLTTNASCKGHFTNTILSPDTGNEQISKILNMFARISYYKSISIGKSLSLSMDYFTWGTEALLITPSLNDELLSSLEDFKNIDITIISLKHESCKYLPNNISLYFYSEEGEKNEGIEDYKVC